MKKTLILVGMFLISFTLVACGDDLATVTPPSFNSISVDGMAPVADGELLTFYKGKNETILIEVNIDNPDGLLITSVIIDGYNYFASRFTESTTTTAIYFEMSAGTTLGLKTLSLDEITYKNGSSTESVLVSSNNEFEKYVFKNIPTVERESYSVNQDSITVNFDILDIDEVIVTDSLIAELYSGETLVGSEILSPGETLVEFVSLLSNKNYEIKVKANFDLDDNTGFNTDVVLYSGPFSTLDNSIPNASITNPVVTSNSIVFDVTYNDENNVTQLDGITVGIFKDGILDVSIPLVHLTGTTVGVTIGDLLNNNEYTLKVLSDYDLLDGHSTITDAVVATHVFSTLPRPLPEVEINNLNIEENRILFDFDIVDPDELIDKDTLIAKLYVEGVLQQEAAVNEYSADFQIFNLFADDTFLIEIEASYDLNDGLGIQEDQVIFSQEFTTYENDAPTVYVDDIVVTQGYVTVAVEVSDEDLTLEGALVAKLYEIYFDAGVETEVEVGVIQFDFEATELVFSYLTSYLKGYRVDILADYDLRDGSVPREDDNIYRSVLLASERKAPAAELNDVIFDTDQIEVNINVMDSDGTIEPNTTFVYLYFNGIVIQTEALVVGNNAITFSGLSSNNEYEIVVETYYNYDLINNSVLLNKTLVSSVVYTLEKTIPAASILPPTGGTDSITFNVIITDDFATITGGTLFAVLYLEDVDTGLSEALSVGNNFGIEFNGLLSDKNYEIRIMADYDLNDGTGEVTDYEMANDYVDTLEKGVPTAAFINIEATQERITFDVTVTDDDLVIVGDAEALLYLGSVYTGESLTLNVGLNSNLIFDPVFSSDRYTVIIVADYNLNNGNPVVLAETLEFDFVNTLTKEEITAQIFEVAEGIDSIEFSVGIIDDDFVGSNYKAVLYLADVQVDELPLIVGENIDESFIGLLSGQTYVLKIEADYDLNEGDGLVSSSIFDTFTTNTEGLNLPTSTFSNIDSDKDSIIMDIIVSDTDSTSSGVIIAALYKDGVATGAEEVLSVGINNDITFGTLLSNNEYEVKVITDYDLNDGNGVIADLQLQNQFITTEAYLVPPSEVSSLVITNTQVSLNFVYEDIDSVLTGGSVKTSLWAGGIKLSEKLLTGTNITFDISTMLADYDFVIKVTGDYNLSDGIGLVDDGSIIELELSTLANLAPTADIVSTEVTQDSINMFITVLDNDDVILNNFKAVLYDKDDLMLEEIDLVVGVNNISFDIIVNHGEMYEVKIVSDYNLLDGLGLHSGVEMVSNIILLVNELIPEARVTDVIIDTTSITFSVEVLDADLTISGNLKAILYKDGVMTASEILLIVGDNTAEVFAGLSSNHVYDVVIVADYDNNNGNGTNATAALDISRYTTLSKVVPTSIFSNVTRDTVSITFDVDVIDDDTAITGNLKAVLYVDGVATISELPLITNDNLAKSFTGLLSGKTYEVRIFADYDLNDEVNVELAIELESQIIATASKAIPSSSITNVLSDLTSITFDVNVTDADTAITGNLKAVLYKDGVATASEILLSVNDNLAESFTGLLSGITYEVKVFADYNLNDAVTVVLAAELVSSARATVAKVEIPTGTISNIVTANSTITFDANIVDSESTITANLQAGLYDADGVQVGAFIPLSVNDNLGEEFTDLMFGTEYEIRLVTDYNLNAGDADITAEDLATSIASTDEMILMTDELVDKKLVSFTLAIADLYDILIPSGDVTQVEVRLYDDTDDLVGDVFYVNEPTDFELINLLSNHDYHIEVFADYDIGFGTVTAEVYTYAFTTLALEIPDIILVMDELVLTAGTNITFSVTGVEDVDHIISGYIDGVTGGTLKAVLYIDGVAEVTTLPIAADGVYTFTGYDGTDGRDYAIVIEATVDLNEDILAVPTDFAITTHSWIYASQN